MTSKETLVGGPQNEYRLGITHNAVIAERLTNPGGEGHQSAMKRLLDMVANDPSALSAIKRQELK